MLLRVHLFGVGGLAIALGLAGCFKDSPGEGSSGGSEEGGCPDGSQSCACYGNGTCDPNLTCSMGVCVPDGCTPGQELCTCVDGECLGELVCEGDVCKPPAGESETSGTSDEGTETGETMESTMSTISTMSESAEGFTTGPDNCDDFGDCVGCQDCAIAGPCAATYSDCLATPDCTALIDCVESCGDDPNCEQVCGEAHPEGAVYYQAFILCVLCEACPIGCAVDPNAC